jgi:hypothetical protein
MQHSAICQLEYDQVYPTACAPQYVGAFGRRAGLVRTTFDLQLPLQATLMSPVSAAEVSTDDQRNRAVPAIASA